MYNFWWKIINFKILKAFTKVQVLKLQNVKRKYLGRHRVLCCLTQPNTCGFHYLAFWPEPPFLHTVACVSELLQLASLGDFLIGKKKLESRKTKANRIHIDKQVLIFQSWAFQLCRFYYWFHQLYSKVNTIIIYASLYLYCSQVNK